MDPPPRSSINPSATPTSDTVSTATQSTTVTQCTSVTPATTVEAESVPQPPATPPHTASSATQTEKDMHQRPERPGQSIASLLNPVSASEGLPQHTHANNATNSMLAVQPLISQPTYHAHQEVPGGTTGSDPMEMPETRQAHASSLRVTAGRQTEQNVSQRPRETISSLARPVTEPRRRIHPASATWNPYETPASTLPPLAPHASHRGETEGPRNTTRPNISEMPEPEQVLEAAGVLLDLQDEGREILERVARQALWSLREAPAACDSDGGNSTISATSTVSAAVNVASSSNASVALAIPTPVTDTVPTTPAQENTRRRRGNSPEEGERRSKRRKKE